MQNTANGTAALPNNTTGSNNTAIGFSSFQGNSTGNNNIAVGAFAGGNVQTASNVICIGANVAGVDVSDRCYIGNISGNPVIGDAVVVDVFGQLGVPTAGSPLSKHRLLEQERMVQKLKATTERQAATIALQKKEITALTASLKQQSATITARFEATDRQQQKQIEALTAGLQKVSAQLELSKLAPQTVKNTD